MASSAAVVAVLQLASMGLGTVLALVIVHQYGKTARTDGLLAAYGLYTLALLVAGTMRTTIVGPLARSGDVGRRLDDFAAGALLLLVALGLPFLVLSGPTASLLTGDLPSAAHDAAESALLAFWPAIGAHLAIAVAAARLALRDEFALAGAAYVVAGLTALATTLLLAGPLGTDAVALGLAAGALLGAALLLVRLSRIGWRPGPRLLRRGSAAARAGAMMFTGAVATMGWQAGYVVTLAFAARLGTGDVTLYTYAFAGASILLTLTAGSASIALAAAVAESFRGDPRTLHAPIRDVLRAGLTILLPALAATWLIGDDVVLLLLGAELDRADAEEIVACLLVLGALVAWNLVAAVPGLAAFASGRHGQMALIALAGLVLHTALSALLGGSLVALAAVHVATMAFLVLALLLLVHGRDTAAVLALAGREAATYGALAALAFLPAGLAAERVGGAAADAAGLLAGLALFALALRRLPARWDVAQRMAAPLLGLARRPAAALGARQSRDSTA